ncbi:[citrate (pro-3S)-lyase] ligase [Melissococcus plutonius]|uniref:[Citrate [pro-3S]-lyase] ligase n=1 Tax=Melissococcus plutonius TaxID=33970 RepID=A0A2Z5Y4H9_9ENTE|nr:[citrate (pro-3S)-lyase] ligase [Melissococcus plutonius]BAL62958.1 [citrate (pro-3S)-lyase] ligase [Melissococcus plutonius DAT561]MCV2498913.1 [citrate (pro-3S)-lyase] ligase [Melissococcus plutonius]MCV2501547.1 [citrate (pro-3S)-lyase] ligase [Melissococcus plutonius]MCV2505799.1 [citrate (pro-3S)-lyase] ligase [Melissococcus plutonius]MCV2508094.1 [citrate (pro-3S)-lyase] ligase [Melissococcus plutonius]
MLIENTRTLYLSLPNVRQSWENLLKQAGITRLASTDYLKVDYAIGIYQKNKLIATASFTKNIMKYFAIDPAYREGGKTFNLLATKLIQEMAQRQIYHQFVATKQEYQQSFEAIGFHCLAYAEQGILLEGGDYSIHDYLAEIPKQKGEKIAAIVMNANPFTLGHYALVKQAAEENDFVYVFVLSEPQEFLSPDERIDLVKQGTKNLNNVGIFPGKEYMVSLATFPTYFLKKDISETEFQTELDARLFKTWVVPALGITKRYLGEEPFSEVTLHYNRSLQKVLEPEVQVVILPRHKKNEIPISASAVRHAFYTDDLSFIKQVTPIETYNFLVKKRKEMSQKNGN